MSEIAKSTRSLNRFLSLCVSTGLTAGIATVFPNIAQAGVIYNGVAAGDPNINSAILWTRATDTVQPSAAVALTLQVATDSGFTTIVSTINGTTDPNRDFTFKTQVKNLATGTTYYYRFINGFDISPTGIFKTAPARNQRVAVRFGFSGDADGQWRPYPSTQLFGGLNLDFFVFLGDTMYETASTGSPAAADTALASTTAGQLLIDYRRKYLENLKTVNAGGFTGLQTLFASSSTFTLLDNHELGNKQFINGGAPLGTLPGLGADATNTANDVNTTGQFINKTSYFQALAKAYSEYHPLLERTLSVPSDPRTDSTQSLFFAQQWGANAIFINVDDRSYRDIRLKTAGNADDTGTRANNPSRTMLGITQLAWLKRTLSLAQTSGITWKIVAVSSPIDEIGNGQDGGKSWVGGYRAERNDLLKYIADNNIKNVVFLSTDDHLNRVNELAYFNDITNFSAGRVVVNNAFTIVAGPLGAGGPDLVTNHSFGNIQALANSLAAAQTASGVNPIGLAATFPGLQNVFREFDANANNNRQPVDFFSPDTFNYATLDISANGQTLSVKTFGINSYTKNTFPEPDPIGNPVRQILGFDLQAQ